VLPALPLIGCLSTSLVGDIHAVLSTSYALSCQASTAKIRIKPWGRLPFAFQKAHASRVWFWK
jgi:hypothetical protein